MWLLPDAKSEAVPQPPTIDQIRSVMRDELNRYRDVSLQTFEMPTVMASVQSRIAMYALLLMTLSLYC